MAVQALHCLCTLSDVRLGNNFSNNARNASSIHDHVITYLYISVLFSLTTGEKRLEGTTPHLLVSEATLPCVFVSGMQVGFDSCMEQQ